VRDYLAEFLSDPRVVQLPRWLGCRSFTVSF
jgi:protoheme ferro-lyase